MLLTSIIRLWLMSVALPAIDGNVVLNILIECQKKLHSSTAIATTFCAEMVCIREHILWHAFMLYLTVLYICVLTCGLLSLGMQTSTVIVFVCRHQAMALQSASRTRIMFVFSSHGPNMAIVGCMKFRAGCLSPTFPDAVLFLHHIPYCSQLPDSKDTRAAQPVSIAIVVIYSSC